MGTDGERAALVSGRNLYTEEVGGAREGVGTIGGDDEEDTETDSRVAEVSPDISSPPHPHNILGQFHEDALTQVGVGSYQWLVCATAGFCVMADGVQLFITPYLETSIQAEMCIDDDRKPWLSGIALLGLVAGALACPLADHIGRRSVLLLGLTLHLCFNIGAAFTPCFGIFVLSRFMGSFGLGVCYPVAGIYFAEFLPQVARGRLSFLLIFWALGGCNVILFASTLLPTNGEEIMYEVKEHQSAWHRVLLLSCLPTVFALASLSCVSESVRYLLHAGKDVNAIMMYQQMYKWNASKSAQYQLTELELPSKVSIVKPLQAKSVWSQIIANIKQFFDSIRQLGQRQNFMSTVLLSLVWAALGFSYHGLGLWIPTRIKHLSEEKYDSQVQISQNLEECGALYVNDIENQKYINVTFNSCVFAHITLLHVTFQNCNLTNVEFSNILSSKTYFIDSIVEKSSFVETDFTRERFISCKMINNTFFTLETPCITDLDFKLRQSDLMTENIIKLNCAFLAFALTVIWIGHMKRSTTGVLGMLFCSLASLACWFLNDSLSLLIFDFIWCLVFLVAFNAINIISIEAFPVHLRATGFGLCFVWFRLMAFWATMFSWPILPGVIITLLIGGVALYRLPDTSHNLM